MDDDDVDFAGAMSDVDGDVILVTGEADVYGAGTDFQIAYFQVVEGLRQARVIEVQPGLLGFNAKSQAGLEYEENGGGRPGLGIASDRVEGRSFTAAPAKATVEFGQPVQVHELTGVIEGTQDANGGIFEAIPCETDGEQGVMGL